MARKIKAICYKDGENAGVYFKDGNRRIAWEDISQEERADLLTAMADVYRLLYEKTYFSAKK